MSVFKALVFPALVFGLLACHSEPEKVWVIGGKGGRLEIVHHEPVATYGKRAPQTRGGLARSTDTVQGRDMQMDQEQASAAPAGTLGKADYHLRPGAIDEFGRSLPPQLRSMANFEQAIALRPGEVYALGDSLFVLVRRKPRGGPDCCYEDARPVPYFKGFVVCKGGAFTFGEGYVLPEKDCCCSCDYPTYYELQLVALKGSKERALRYSPTCDY